MASGTKDDAGGCRRMDGALKALNIPSAALVASFSIVPIAYIAYLSLYDIRFGGGGGFFVGLENYEFILSDSSMIRALWNTAYFSFFSVAIATVAGLLIALLMDSDTGLNFLLVPAVILPWAVPEIVNALMWQWIYNPNYGALNGLLYSLGLMNEYGAWMSTPVSAMTAVIFAYSWKLAPFVVIILYAGLRSIPAELHESAQIDGAGYWQHFRYVTIPMLAPSIAVAVLFCLVWSMRAFDLVYLLTKGGPGEATSVLSYFVFAKAFDFGDVGAASAAACVLAVLTFVMTCLYIRVLPKGEEAA